MNSNLKGKMLPQTDTQISRFTIEKQLDNRISFILYDNLNNPVSRMLFTKEDILTIMAHFSSVLREERYN